MGRSFMIVVLVLAVAAAWWFIPRGRQTVGVEGGGHGVSAAGSSLGDSLGEPGAFEAPASAVAASATSDADAMPESVGLVDDAEDVDEDPPRMRRLRIVSEMDGEDLVDVTVRVLGSVKKGRTEFSTDEQGEVKLPISSALRCRFELDGYVAKNVGQIGLLPGDPIEIVLRPVARLYGRVETPMPVHVPAERYGPMMRDRSPQPGVLGAIKLVVDRRLPYQEGTQSNFRGIQDATRRMPETDLHVREDGTWSLELEIPPEIDALHAFVVEQVCGAGSRTVGTVALIKPGDAIEVKDAWATAQPLNLRFVSGDGAALSSELRLTFRRDTPDGFIEQFRGVKPDSEGRVSGATFAQGTWNYLSSNSSNPRDIVIEGSFEHRDGSERVIKLPAGGPLTVVFPRVKGKSFPTYKVGVASAGQSPKSRRYIDEGEEVTFPFVPAQGAWELVVLGEAKKQRRGGNFFSERDYVEVQRLPIPVDERRIELRLP